MKQNPLIQLGNIPVQFGTLSSIYKEHSTPVKKISALEKDGQLIKLKKGLYVVSELVSGKPIDARLCANHIYGPSYVSFQWALRWYGLIPEQVHTMTSATTKHSRTFDNTLGRFSYTQVPLSYFHIGVKCITDGDISCLMATPEKALCDTILTDRYIPSRSTIGLHRYLEEDIRFDMESLAGFNTGIIRECADAGRKTVILNNLIKIIKG